MELWMEVKGYEGLYEISSRGRVRSNIRDIVDKNGHRKFYDEIILKPYVPKDGYPRVVLYKLGVKKTWMIHRLVAEAFIPKQDYRNEVNHIDEVKSNNILENLEWVSNRENDNHGSRNERIGKKLSKLTYQYDMDWNLVKVWESTMDAERNGGFNSKLISRTCLGISETHKGFRWSYERVYIKGE